MFCLSTSRPKVLDSQAYAHVHYCRMVARCQRIFPFCRTSINLVRPFSIYAYPKQLKILGIETSCDDTGCAIVSSDRIILSESLRQQHKHHEPFGGIMPTVASSYHSVNLPLVVLETLEKAQLEISELDAIAVTRGPGLLPCLGVGLNAAKMLSAVCKKPLIGVHHMEAHALTARLTTPNPSAPTEPTPSFPFLTLLISGGHTLLLLAHSVGCYTQLGTTVDDAIGEAIDKTARVLGLKWSDTGPGVALERAASKGNKERFNGLLPIPMNHLERAKEIVFSFSGVKAAARKMVEVEKKVDILVEKDVNDFAAAFQEVCMKHLVKKTRLALEKCAKEGIDVTTLVVSGGVASNETIRGGLKNLADSYPIPLVFPPVRLCTDNGVMIAWAGLEVFREGLVDDHSILALPKWPIETLRDRLKNKVSVL